VAEANNWLTKMIKWSSLPVARGTRSQESIADTKETTIAIPSDPGVIQAQLAAGDREHEALGELHRRNDPRPLGNQK